MHNLKRFLKVTSTAMVLVSAAVSARATGFDLPDQDAFVIARGMAFVATADNPSAIYYNPAGITQLQGNNARFGIYGLYLDPTYKNASGAKFDNQKNNHAIPQFFYTFTPEKSPWSFGLGAYSPFGLSSSWPQDTGFRTVATKGQLSSYTINPVAALKLTPNLSIGAGVTATYADLDLQRGLVWPAQPYDNFRFTGNGWAVGYNLGLLWKPQEKISIGVTFRSSTTFSLDGRTEYHNNVTLPLPPELGGGTIPAFPAQRAGANADFSFPLKAIFGISYRPTTNWNLEFNADYTDWTALGTVTVRQTTAFPPVGPPLVPKNIPLTLNWDSSWYYEFGVTRYLRDGWSVSAGYIYNENSVPDAHYNPLVADLDRHFLSIGAGHKGKRFDIDLAYQFGYGPARTVTGSAPSGTGQTADGQYDFISHAVAVSVGMHF
jgi:long-chain fatty acid transport protein